MDSILGVHEGALLLRAKRMEVLAGNLANADTPNFKARDLDFAAALDRSSSRATKLAATDPRHFNGAPLAERAALKYRNPYQPAQDGNTVEADLELARYAENSVAYQTSLMLVNRKFAGLRLALTGGR